jgi:hypothetical protein
VDAALIRDLDIGQAAYIYRGGVTYVQVKRLVGAPAAMAGRPDRAAVNRAAASGRTAACDGRLAPDGGAAGPMAWPAGGRVRTAGAPPDVSAVLDAAFGPEPQA